MTLGVWAVLLLVVGLLLLVAEVFLPSGGILAVLTAGTLLASLTSIAIGLRPKESSIAVSQAVANAIVVGVIVALLVHAVVSTLTAI